MSGGTKIKRTYDGGNDKNKDYAKGLAILRSGSRGSNQAATVYDDLRHGGKIPDIPENAGAMIEEKLKRFDFLRAKAVDKKLSEDEAAEMAVLKPNVVLMLESLTGMVAELFDEKKERVPLVRFTVGGGAAPTAPNPKVIAAIAAAATQNMGAGDKGPGPGPGDKGPGDKEKGEPDALIEKVHKSAKQIEKDEMLIQEILGALGDKPADDSKPMEYPDLGSAIVYSGKNLVEDVKKKLKELMGNDPAKSRKMLNDALPQFPDGTDPAKVEEIMDEAKQVVHGKLSEIEQLLSVDIRNITSAASDAVMNGFSLIPGVGTTLLLWRLLTNLGVALGGSLTSFMGAKKIAGSARRQLNELKAKVESAGDEMEAAASNAVPDVGSAGTLPPTAVSGVAPVAPNASALTPPAGLPTGAAPGAAVPPAAPPVPSGGAIGGQPQQMQQQPQQQMQPMQQMQQMQPMQPMQMPMQQQMQQQQMQPQQVLQQMQPMPQQPMQPMPQQVPQQMQMQPMQGGGSKKAKLSAIKKTRNRILKTIARFTRKIKFV